MTGSKLRRRQLRLRSAPPRGSREHELVGCFALAMCGEHLEEERRERDATAAVVLGRAVDQLAADLGDGLVDVHAAAEPSSFAYSRPTST
ncbi:MAG: hypothetical protein AB7K08_04890 [Microbacteriaceae bacterium]